jgi:hypothetical protein
LNKIVVDLLNGTKLLCTKQLKPRDQKPCLEVDYHGQAANDLIKEMLVSSSPV